MIDSPNYHDRLLFLEQLSTLARILRNLFQRIAREKFRMGCKFSCMNHFLFSFIYSYSDLASIHLLHLLPPKAPSRLAASFIYSAFHLPAYPITVIRPSGIHRTHQLSWTQRMAIHRLCCAYFQCCSCLWRSTDAIRTTTTWKIL